MENQPDNYDKPVAYDVEGRPLYARPQEITPSPATSAPTVVHVERPADLSPQPLSPAAKLRHDKSRAAYPELNISEGEFVIMAIRRHPIGLALPVGVSILLMAMSLSALFNLDIIQEMFEQQRIVVEPIMLAVFIMLFTALTGLGAYIAYYIFTNNRFFLTNESVIQQNQTALFAKNEQTVSLANIEDVSYDQKGIIQQLFNYGSIRLSTEGDETTYRFTYVSTPKDQTAILNSAVESFKNGRPVIPDED